MSAFACWMVARALLASAATSTMPVPSSSCARWISSYLWGQDGALQHFKGTGGCLGSGHGGKGLKHPQHRVPPRPSPPAPDGQGAVVSCCQPSPGLQLTLCFPRRSPFQQALQELVAGFGHIQRSPDHRLHLCHRIPVPAGRRAPREVSSGEERPPHIPQPGRQPPLCASITAPGLQCHGAGCPRTSQPVPVPPAPGGSSWWAAGGFPGESPSNARRSSETPRLHSRGPQASPLTPPVPLASHPSPATSPRSLPNPAPWQPGCRQRAAPPAALTAARPRSLTAGRTFWGVCGRSSRWPGWHC